MRCIKCNSSLSERFSYCPYCGKPRVKPIKKLGEFSQGEWVLTEMGGAKILALIPPKEKISSVLKSNEISVKGMAKLYQQSYISNQERAVVLLDENPSDYKRYVDCVTLDKLTKAE